MAARGKSVNETQETNSTFLETWYDKYAPTLLSLCFRYCGNNDDAQDVLHDGFIKIIRNIATFRQREKGTFEGWMKRIMVNTALNFLRYSAREKHFPDTYPILERSSESADDDTFFEEMSGFVDVQTLLNMISNLPVGYRAVFNMYVFDSYSHREIAEIMNYTENTSRSQLTKARILLRKQLNESFIKQKETL